MRYFCLNRHLFLFLSNGSVQADIKVIATINTNTTRKDEAIDYLIEGLDTFSGERLKVTAIAVQGKQAKVISFCSVCLFVLVCLFVFFFSCMLFFSATKQ